MEFKLVKDDEKIKKLEEILKQLGLPYVEWESSKEPAYYISVRISHKVEEML